MDTKMILANGVNLRYLDMPNEGKDTIVLIPCGGGTIGMWNGFIPYFKNDFRIVALDMRCHGFSDDPEDCYLDDMANDVAAVLDKLGIENACIIGSSLGAEVALSLAANHSEKVKALILDGAFYDIAGPDSKDQTITDEAIAEAKSKLKEIIFAKEIKLFEKIAGFLAKTINFEQLVQNLVNKNIVELKKAAIVVFSALMIILGMALFIDSFLPFNGASFILTGVGVILLIDKIYK